MTKELRIGGMTCVNCERVIKNGLCALQGVKTAEVSYRKGSARIVFDPAQLSFGRIKNTVKALGYDVLPQKAQDRQGLRRTVLLPLVIVAAYALLERFGVLNLLVPSQLAKSGMGYGMLFVVGLLTSVHCIAMCGGINLSQCLPAGMQKGRGFAPALLYNLGRVMSYTACGFFLGLAGQLLGGNAQSGISIALQGVLKLFAGAVMLLMGVNMLGVFPWLRRLTPGASRTAAAWMGKRKASISRPLVVGLLNGLMPCGPLQSMQILALASGSAIAGALSMLMFSLGTVPLMLGLGTLVSALGKRFAHEVMQIGAVLVAVLGLAMIAQGGSLSGLFTPATLFFFVSSLFALGIAASIPRKAYRALSVTACLTVVLVLGAARQSIRSDGGFEAAKEPDAGSVQLVESVLYPWQYPTITVQAGVPVKWTIRAEASSINGCNEIMVLPEYDIAHGFTEGENVIEFTPTQAGTYPYSCWMGMIRGSIVVN